MGMFSNPDPFKHMILLKNKFGPARRRIFAVLTLLFFCNAAQATDLEISLPPASVTPPASLEFRSNTFDDLDPVCRFRGNSIVSETAADGVCGSNWPSVNVPKYYGDLAIDFDSQCQWQDDCYVARNFGGTYSQQQCDDIFQKKLEDECRRTVSSCSNVLQHCLATVEAFSRAVSELGASVWSSVDGNSRPTDTTVFGPEDQVASVPPDNQPAGESSSKSTGEAWVYVGKFDNVWVTRHFDVQRMISGGESISAIDYVNVRNSLIKLGTDGKTWVNGEKIGLVRPGESVTVTRVENVSQPGRPAHIWARINR